MKKFILIVISIIIISFTLILVVSEKKEFSENENRYLEMFPEFNFKDLESGEYISKLEKYFNDHFPFRDSFMGLKTNFEKLLGKSIINDIYLGKDNFMLTKYNEIDTVKLVDKLNLFTNDKEQNISLLLIPSSISIYSEKLPKYAVTGNELKIINDLYNKVNMNNIDIYNSLIDAKNNYQIFYKTDHHWTTYGAYYAYLEFCKKNNIIPKSIDEFDIEKVTDSFYGTLYSKTNNYNVEADSIYLFKTNTKYEINYIDKNIIDDKLYNYEFLDKKDKYSIFLNNNHSLITINNKDINNMNEILIIKDSYGNSITPFITEHFYKTHVVDLRYNLNSMTSYLNDNPNITEILIVYNINTINADSSIYYLR